MVFYEDAKEVERDVEQACFWYKLAANQGHNGAKNVLLKRFQVGYSLFKEKDRKEKRWHKDLSIKEGCKEKEKYKMGYDQ